MALRVSQALHGLIWLWPASCSWREPLIATDDQRRQLTESAGDGRLLPCMLSSVNGSHDGSWKVFEALPDIVLMEMASEDSRLG